MNLIIKNIDDEVVKKSNGISMPHQIVYASVNGVIVDEVEYQIVRKVFDHKKDELNIIVDQTR